MLQPLNPTSRGLADLSGNEDSLLNVAMKRKEIELDLGKQAAAAREAADKQKEAARATLDKLPQTVKLEHTKAYSKLYNATQQRLGRILQANGGVMPAPGTPAHDEYNALAQNLAQVAANSEQLDTRRAAYLDEFTKNPTLYPNLTKGDIEDWGTDEDMLSGSLPDNPLEANFDIAGYAEPFFSKIKPDQIAWAGPAAGGGAQAGSTERVLPEDIKTVAEGIAIDDRFQKAALRQFKNFSPEKQAFITGLAEKNGMTIPAAIALDLGTGLERYTKQERSYTQPGSASIGAAREESAINWVLEVFDGMEAGDLETLKDLRLNPFKGVKEFNTGDINFFNDWVINKQQVAVPGSMGQADKVVEANDVVTKTSYNPSTKMWTFRYKNDATGKTGQITAPREQVDSEIIPELVGLNTDRMKGIGAYGASMEKLDEGKVQGSSAERMRKSQQGGVSEKWSGKTRAVKYN